MKTEGAMLNVWYGVENKLYKRQNYAIDGPLSPSRLEVVDLELLGPADYD